MSWKAWRLSLQLASLSKPVSKVRSEDATFATDVSLTPERIDALEAASEVLDATFVAAVLAAIQEPNVYVSASRDLSPSSRWTQYWPDVPRTPLPKGAGRKTRPASSANEQRRDARRTDHGALLGGPRGRLKLTREQCGPMMKGPRQTTNKGRKEDMRGASWWKRMFDKLFPVVRHSGLPPVSRYGVAPELRDV
jgi:hypothetical protein